jgi:hypothetical protein
MFVLTNFGKTGQPSQKLRGRDRQTDTNKHDDFIKLISFFIFSVVYLTMLSVIALIGRLITDSLIGNDMKGSSLGLI